MLPLALAACERGRDYGTVDKLDRHQTCNTVATFLVAYSKNPSIFFSPLLDGLDQSAVIGPYPSNGQSWPRAHPFISRIMGKRLVAIALPWTVVPSPKTEKGWYEQVRRELTRNIRTYTDTYNCIVEFKAANLRLDPGKGQRERLMLEHKLAFSRLEKVKRPVILRPDVMWITASSTTCAPTTDRNFLDKMRRNPKRPAFWTGGVGYFGYSGRGIVYKVGTLWKVLYDAQIYSGKNEIDWRYGSSCPDG